MHFNFVGMRKHPWYASSDPRQLNDDELAVSKAARPDFWHRNWCWASKADSPTNLSSSYAFHILLCMADGLYAIVQQNPYGIEPRDHNKHQILWFWITHCLTASALGKLKYSRDHHRSICALGSRNAPTIYYIQAAGSKATSNMVFSAPRVVLLFYISPKQIGALPQQPMWSLSLALSLDESFLIVVRRKPVNKSLRTSKMDGLLDWIDFLDWLTRLVRHPLSSGRLTLWIELTRPFLSSSACVSSRYYNRQ